MAEAVGSRLTVAFVDDSGRLLEFCVINDDPAGYDLVTSLLAERFGGSTAVTVAVDSDEHLVISLLATSGRAIAYADDEAADDFADRFADDESLDEVQSAPDERRAVGLARALQAGALSAVVGPAPREFAAFKPVLAAHAALATGRHAAAVALREVLRELYPAALRAYPDPAEPIALAVLEALPESSMLAAPAGGRNRDNNTTAEAVAARLVADGVCDSGSALEAVTALRVAIAETPRRSGVGKQLTSAVAETVRHSVAAVRSTDAARGALMHTLVDRMAPQVATPAPASAPLRRTGVTVTSAPPAPAPVRRTGVTVTSAPPAPATGGRRRAQPTPVNPVPMAPTPVAPPPVAPRPLVGAPVAAAEATPPAVERPSWAPSVPLVPPGFEPTPVTGTPVIAPAPARPPATRRAAAPQQQPPVSAPSAPMQQPAPALQPQGGTVPHQRNPRSPAETGAPFVPTLTNAVIHHERSTRGFNAPPPTADLPGPLPPRLNDPLSAPPLSAPVSSAPISAAPISVAPISPAPVSPAPILSTPIISTSAPTRAFSAEPQSAPPAPAAPAGSRANWPLVGEQDDLARPANRVTPPWQADDLVLPEAPQVRATPRPLSNLTRRGHDELDGPPLRLVDEGARPAKTKPRRTERAAPAPVDTGDDDLLIFASVSSAWFTGQEDESESTWNSSADTGWRAAEQAARPSVGNDTNAGLPRRVPQANLVPGSPITNPERPLRIVRDAADIATHTSNYFRGWRRGNQEVGGFAVGGRPGRESAEGWDFSREHDVRDDRDEYGYRAANYR
jgi:hypothetical protein